MPAEPSREACSLSLLRCSSSSSSPSTQQTPVMSFRAVPLPPPPMEAGGFRRRCCGRTRRIQAQSLCKQDIRLCQKDQKSLEVFLHSLSLPPSLLSLYLCLAVSRQAPLARQAGRHGCGGDPALCQGLQQAQGPQHLLAPGPPPDHGFPRTYRVSTCSCQGPTARLPCLVRPLCSTCHPLDKQVLLTSC